MRRIPLLDREGEVVAHALVEAELYDWLNQWTWRLSNYGYAVRGTTIAGVFHTLAMHRVIVGLGPGDRPGVDHEDGDGLNNRRSNLRVATQVQNGQNRTRSNANNTSGYRGVTWDKHKRKWLAQVMIARRNHYVGRYSTAEQAHAAATAFRAEHMPFSRDARCPR